MLVKPKGGGPEIDVCDACKHMKSSLKAIRLVGGAIQRTCNCECHPPTSSINVSDLRPTPWHEPEPEPVGPPKWG